MRAFLDGAPFVFTGPEQWNALGLGTTAVFATPLVYNGRRSGNVQSRRAALRPPPRRLPGPPDARVVCRRPSRERRGRGGIPGMIWAMRWRGHWRGDALDRQSLHEAARRYGTRRTQDVVERAVERGSTERA